MFPKTKKSVGEGLLFQLVKAIEKEPAEEINVLR